MLRYILALIFPMISYASLATHLRAVEIQVRRTECSSTTVEITITAYTDYFNTTVLFAGEGSQLSFGDGTSHVFPEGDYEILDADLHVAVTRYTVSHTYSDFGYYVISYRESNRNVGILNFGGSANTAFYTETAFVIEDGVCDNSPSLLLPPIDRACSGVAFYHNPGAVDSDGDSLSYELTIPEKEKGVNVDAYLSPDATAFYTSEPYTQANEAGDGEPSISIDPLTGTLTWDAPGSPGEYGIAFKVKEWKYNVTTGAWYEAGYVIRDMQIIVEECTNRKPELEIPLDVCITAGNILQLDIPASDPDHHDVVIETASEIFMLPDSQATIKPVGTVQSTEPPYDTAAIQIVWKTSCLNVRASPYQIVLKISDRPPSGPRLLRFYTIDIKVVAPEPEYESVSINPVTKTVSLKWKPYSCENVHAFQIWRRISEYKYDPAECAVGMPAFLHYQLMAEVPGSEFEFSDSDLAFGSQYCYRIVALVGNMKTPGRLSLDTCFIPKPAEAPVITNVSVESTGTVDGTMQVRWTKPFDIDPLQYPPPYVYQVLRKNESDPQSVFKRVTSTAIADTVFTDTGLNTVQNVYRYAIELYVPALATSPVDTSSAASSAFLTTQGLDQGIRLHWTANTPWSNYSQEYPDHVIYRSTSADGPFELIDVVNVHQFDFNYIDRGEFKNQGLTDAVYYYKIKTRGSYGNPAIASPLENLTQVAPGQLLDTIPPCVPDLTVAAANCFEFACDGSDYYTALTWNTDCPGEVVAYEILVQENKDEKFTLLTTLKANSYVHSNIASLNKCYSLISVDRAGNRSDTSAVVCNANCTNFKLPNVITPGKKDNHNDYLTTYPPDSENRLDCARSVEVVDLQIFSRWGDEIFTTTVEGDSPVFWDGRNSNGAEVSSGTYFYEATVLFDTNDPSKQKQQIKGWVYVIR